MLAGAERTSESQELRPCPQPREWPGGESTSGEASDGSTAIAQRNLRKDERRHSGRPGLDSWPANTGR